MASLIDTLEPYLLTLSIASVVLAFVVLGLLAWMIRRAAGRSAADMMAAAAKADATAEDGVQVASASAAEVASETSGRSLKKSFAGAMTLLRRHVAGRNPRYRIPWFVMLGEADSGKTSALHGVGLNLPLGRPVEAAHGLRRGCNWWFFDRGIVLDPAGDMVLRRDGASADEGEWRTFLSLLRKTRPRRPLDGVVLALPAASLLEDDRRVLAAKADVLNRKLWQVQKTLGMVFPVYVLVTKCDEVPGFASFWREIPAERHGQMFGWSSPYSLDTAYAPGWLDEAFAAVDEALYQGTVEIAGTRTPGDGDGLFLFPGRFRRLHEPLAAFLDQVLRPSVYHETFFFRGVYFAGDAGSDGAADEAPPLAAHTGLFAGPERETAPGGHRAGARPILVSDLFELKVFPEHGLAKPAAGSLIGRTRSLTAARASLAGLAVVLGGGLAFSYLDLTQEVSSLRPILIKVGEDIAQYDEREAAFEKVLGARSRDLDIFHESSAKRLLDAMTRIKTDSLATPFFPSSWFSDMDDLVSRFLAGAFDRIIMQALHQRLQKRTDVAFERAKVAPDQDDGEIHHLEDTIEFRQLTAFLEELSVLSDMVDRYNGLGRSGRLDDMSTLAQFAFNVTLPPGFFEHAEFYRGAVKSVHDRAISYSDYKPRATTRIRDMVWRLNQRMFTGGALGQQLHDLTRVLREVERPRPNAEAEAADFQRLLAMIDRTAEMLANPDLVWLAGDTLTVTGPLAPLLARIGTSPFLGPDLVAEFLVTGQNEFDRFKRRLGAYRAGLTGPVLEHDDGKVRLQLAPSLVALRAAFGSLFRQSFMTVQPRREITTDYSPVRRLTWNVPRLDEAIRLYGEYDRYTVESLSAFPQTLQTRVGDLALLRLTDNMVTTIAQAQESRAAADSWRLQNEDDLAAEVRDFRKAADDLQQLLTVFYSLELPAAYQALYDIALLHAGDLLDRADRRLQSEGLYLPGQPLARWEGMDTPAFYAFQVRDDAEALNYLDLQRERIAHLLDQFVEPLIGFLSNTHFRRELGSMPQVSRWRRIYEEIRKYYNRQPGSSVVALEKFIRFDMAEAPPRDCAGRFADAATDRPTGDFFLIRRNELRAALFGRCTEMAAGSLTERYMRLADAFNRRLAGSYPFANVPAGGAVRDAEPEAIRAYFRLFDGEKDTVLKSLRDAPLDPGQREQALTFMARMETVHAFFAPLLDAPAEQRRPAWDVSVDFRVNRWEEAGGNRIIDWALTLGPKTIGLLDEPRSGTWRYGDRVALRLRWAKDSPARPVASGKPGYRVEDGLNAVFELGNAWSLLRFLETHAAADDDVAEGTDPEPHTLTISVDTVESLPWLAGSPDAKPGAVVEAKVFIRLGLSAAAAEGGKPVRLVLPDFPRRAPILGRDEAAER